MITADRISQIRALGFGNEVMENARLKSVGFGRAGFSPLDFDGTGKSRCDAAA
jgi:hypothetical protein